MKRVFLLAILIMVLVCSHASAKEVTYERVRNAINRIDVEDIKNSEVLLENVDPVDGQYALLALIYSFYTDFYTFIEEDKNKAKTYNDSAIETAQKALEYDYGLATTYSIVAEGYANKITGPFSGIRYGRRVSDAIEMAEAIDPGNEHLAYLQAKRYLLAPSLAGGDRNKAIAGFTKLTELNPASSFYFAFLGECYKRSDQELAQAMFQRAIVLSPNNTWAIRELQ